MKVLRVVILVLLLASGSTSFKLSYILPDDADWFVPISQKNDTFGWITRAIVTAELREMTNITKFVNYYLFTRGHENNPQILIKDNSTNLQQTNFDPKRNTRIIIHGFQSSYNEVICSKLVDAYLKKHSYNVICVDWAPIAGKTYPTARLVLPNVARDVSEFIQFLMRDGKMDIENLVVIGHSLGAHVSGIAGKELKAKNIQIPWIIGCDPALPLFSYGDCSSRLCKTDAKFVETIQTDGGKFGFLLPIGGGTYYPNGGKYQPGCGVQIIGVCSHGRSYLYLAEAIELDDFETVKCRNYKSAVAKKCGKKYSSVKMGSRNSIGVNGVFYVPVNSKSPYGKGNKAQAM